MLKIFSAIESLARKEAKNPVVLRTVHTIWEAAAGAGVAALTGAHGDVRFVITAAAAGAFAAVKTAIVAAVEAKAPSVAPIVAAELHVPAPAADVTVVSTPSTPAS